MSDPPVNAIGTLRERSLHAALKTWYAEPGDLLEHRLDGCIVDLLRDELAIEIQTRSLGALKPKLDRLLINRRVRVVYPLSVCKYIVRESASGCKTLSRRRSPKRADAFSIFDQLVHVARYCAHPGFALDIVSVEEEEVRREDGRGSWRRKGQSVRDRRLLSVVGHCLYQHPRDYLTLLPNDLPEPFSTADIATGAQQPRWLAQKAAYTLKTMGALRQIDKRGNERLYVTVPRVRATASACGPK